MYRKGLHANSCVHKKFLSWSLLLQFETHDLHIDAHKLKFTGSNNVQNLMQAYLHSFHTTTHVQLNKSMEDYHPAATGHNTIHGKYTTFQTYWVIENFRQIFSHVDTIHGTWYKIYLTDWENSFRKLQPRIRIIRESQKKYLKSVFICPSWSNDNEYNPFYDFMIIYFISGPFKVSCRYELKEI